MNEIAVNFEAGADEFARRLFGYQPADEALARLAGALPGAAVNVAVRQDKGWLYLTVSDARFERYESSIRQDPDGGLFAYIHHAYAAAGQRGKGYGVRAFLRQVHAARQFGLKRFELFAAGRPGASDENGYYTWARFGFDVPLNEIEQRGLPDALRGALTVNQAIQRNGREWWKAAGNARSMVFDLRGDSAMMKTFRAYLNEKGITEEIR